MRHREEGGKNRAAYVTGVGVVSPVGIGREAFWKALLENRSGVGPITLFDPDGFDVRIAAECAGFDAEDFVNRKLARKLDRFAQLGVAAAGLALEDSGAMGFLEKNPERAGVVFGTGIGGVGTMERVQWEMDEKGPGRVNPFAITKIMPNAAAGYISIRFGLQGPSNSPALACTTGTDAVGQGLDLIRRGEADLVVCGASEAPVTPTLVAGFQAMRAMSRRNDDPEGACRPYDKDHSGFVLGEGAAVLVLEGAESAERRGAEPYARVTGSGRSTDALHPFDPDPEGRGVLRAMRLALEDAGIEGESIGYVNPHGTGTPAGDGPESGAVAKAAPGAMVSATKSTLGHAQGASGAIETAICALALKNKTVPPMRNLETLAEGCAELDYVVGKPREAPGLEAALCANLGVGGHNAAVVLQEAV
jgi:3-oxoacyl-[acyl-carrier-protein] synthase II